MQPHHKHKVANVLIASAVAGAAVVAAAHFGVERFGSLSQMIEVAADNATMPWVLGVMTFFMGIIVVPTMPIQILIGILYGWGGIPLALVAMGSATSVGYLIGRWIGEDAALAKIDSEAGQKFVDVAQANGSVASFLARVIPGIPFALQNYTLGGLRIPPHQFVIGSVPGVSIVTAISVMIGIAGGEALHRVEEGLEHAWGLPVVTIIVGLWMHFRAFQAKRKLARQSDQTPPSAV